MHIEKYGKSAMGHMLAHYERAKDVDGQYVTYNNENIDPSKTYMNYDCLQRIYQKNKNEMEEPLKNGYEQFDRIMNRPDVHCMNRADVNVVCDCIFTVPEGMADDEIDRCLDGACKFLVNRYGVRDNNGNVFNIVSCHAHKDEPNAQPHIHFAFVPLLRKRKKKTGIYENFYRVDAKDVVSRNNLRTLHNDLNTFMTDRFGRDIGVMNGKTADGNMTIKQLKERTELQNRVAELESEVAAKDAEIKKIKDEHKVEIDNLLHEYQDKVGTVITSSNQIESNYRTQIDEINETAKKYKDMYFTAESDVDFYKTAFQNVYELCRYNSYSLPKNIRDIFDTGINWDDHQNLSESVYNLSNSAEIRLEQICNNRYQDYNSYGE